MTRGFKGGSMRRIGFAVGTLVAGTALVVVAGVPSVYTTGDAAVAIPDNSMGVITACQTINVPDSGTIGDVNVEVTSAHSWVGDVTFELTSPAATTVTIMNRPARTGTGAGSERAHAAARGFQRETRISCFTLMASGGER